MGFSVTKILLDRRQCEFLRLNNGWHDVGKKWHSLMLNKVNSSPQPRLNPQNCLILYVYNVSAFALL